MTAVGDGVAGKVTDCSALQDWKQDVRLVTAASEPDGKVTDCSA